MKSSSHLIAAVAVVVVAFAGVGAHHVVSSEQQPVDVDVVVHEGLHDDEALLTSGRPFPAAFTVTSAAVTTLQLSSTAVTRSMKCVVTTASTPLFLVDPTASNTSSGEGPYCTNCAGGSVFAVPAAKAYARTSSGSADVRCSFYDGDVAPSSGGVAAAGVAGEGAAGRVAYWDSASSLTSSSTMTTDGVTLSLSSTTTAPKLDFSVAGSGFVALGQCTGDTLCMHFGGGLPTGLTINSLGITPTNSFANTIDLGTPSARFKSAFLQTVNVTAGATNQRVATLRGASGDNTLVEWLDGSGTTKSFTGLAGSADAVITGSAAGDFVTRVASGKLMFSADAGSTSSLNVDSAGLQAKDGTSAAPSYSFASVPTEGMYVDDASDTLILDGQVSSGVGNVSIVAGDVAAISVGSTGSWGMTTANSSAEVSGDGADGGVVVNADTDFTVTTPGTGAGSVQWTFNNAGLVATHRTTTTPPTMQVPSAIATAPGTAPACSSSTPAAMVYIDDTDDAFPAFLCMCAANAAGTYAYRPIGDFTSACP